MADHIRTIPQGVFDMEGFREGQHITPECDSVGCVLGHCVGLDPNPDGIARWEDEGINFFKWSANFTGLSVGWAWCFSGKWVRTDNTPKGAALRIEWLLKHGLPKDWYEQLKGMAPLCYKVK